jgi:hypothetical protein
VRWFDAGGALKVSLNERSDACLKGFAAVPGLVDVVVQFGMATREDVATLVSGCELVLEGLVSQKRISRSDELGYSRARPDKPPFGKNPGAGPNLFT